MCVIINKEAGKSFSKAQIEAAATRNAHGYGAMWFDPEVRRIKTEKRLFSSPSDIMTLFEDAHKDKHIAFHFRLATHGSKTDANCHPFQVLSLEEDGVDMYMMHNGVISWVTREGDITDSEAFATKYLKPILKLNPLLVESPEFKKLISEAIGGSKLLFMYTSGDSYKVSIINESLGAKLNECWVSNTHSLSTYSPTTYTGNYSYAGRGYGDSFRWDGSQDYEMKKGDAVLVIPDAVTGEMFYGEIIQIGPCRVRWKEGGEICEDMFTPDGEVTRQSLNFKGYCFIPLETKRRKYLDEKAHAALINSKLEEAVQEQKKSENTPAVIAADEVDDDDDYGYEPEIHEFRHGVTIDFNNPELSSYTDDTNKTVSLMQLYDLSPVDRYIWFSKNPDSSFAVFQDLLEFCAETQIIEKTEGACHVN